jgi:hypothetical protein
MASWVVERAGRISRHGAVPGSAPRRRHTPLGTA